MRTIRISIGYSLFCAAIVAMLGCGFYAGISRDLRRRAGHFTAAERAAMQIPASCPSYKGLLP